MNSPKKQLDKYWSDSDLDDFEKQYESLISDYELMGKNIKLVLKKILNDEKIKYVDVKCRIKKWDSVKDKIERKGDKYENPLSEIQDFCGIRIICYYKSDIKKIEDLLRYEFFVEDTDKHETKPEEFSYNFTHFIIKLKNEWLGQPLFRGLDELKAEIQLGTILNHAWANVSHEIFYKKEDEKTDDEKRRLSSIKALLEIADQEIIGLKEKHAEETFDDFEEFDLNQEINPSSMIKFLEIALPDKNLIETNIHNICGQISLFNEQNADKKINFSNLKKAVEEREGVILHKEKIEDKNYDKAKFLKQILCNYYPNFIDYV